MLVLGLVGGKELGKVVGTLVYLPIRYMPPTCCSGVAVFDINLEGGEVDIQLRCCYGLMLHVDHSYQTRSWRIFQQASSFF